MVYNIGITSNTTLIEKENKMTLTPNELLAMVASVELDEHDMQCALAEYEYHEANWEDMESDDSHIELYED
jgi:hypothetical protein